MQDVQCTLVFTILILMGVSGFMHKCQCKTKDRFVLEKVTMT
jgi:hypothetical protein